MTIRVLITFTYIENSITATAHVPDGQAPDGQAPDGHALPAPRRSAPGGQRLPAERLPAERPVAGCMGGEGFGWP